MPHPKVEQECPECHRLFFSLAAHRKRANCGTGRADRHTDQLETSPDCPVAPSDDARSARNSIGSPLNHSSSTKPPELLFSAFHDCCFALLAFFHFEEAIFESALQSILQYALKWVKVELSLGRSSCVGPSSSSQLAGHVLSTLSLGVPLQSSENERFLGSKIVARVRAAILTEDLLESNEQQAKKVRTEASSTPSRSSEVSAPRLGLDVDLLLRCIFRGPHQHEAEPIPHTADREVPGNAASATCSSLADLMTSFYVEHPGSRIVHARQLFSNGLFQFLHNHPKLKKWAVELALLDPGCVNTMNHAELANMLTLYIVPTVELSSRLRKLMLTNRQDSDDRSPEDVPLNACANSGTSLMSVSTVRDRYQSSLQSLQEQKFAGFTRVELLLQFCAKYNVPSRAAVDAALFGSCDPPEPFRYLWAALPAVQSHAAFAALSAEARSAINETLQSHAFSTFATSFSADDDTLLELQVWSAATTPIAALFLLCHATASSVEYDQYLIRRYRLPLTRRVTKVELVQCFWNEELLVIIRNFLLSRFQSEAERWAFVERCACSQGKAKRRLFSSLKPLIVQSSAENLVVASFDRPKLIDLLAALAKNPAQ